MTDQELNIAIAKLVGWKFHPEFPDGPDYPAEYTTEAPDGKMLCGYYPDYCNDLNATHEAEVLLSKTRVHKYAEELMDAVRAYPIGVIPDWDHDRRSLVVVARATARQRAEALYRTLQKPES